MIAYLGIEAFKHVVENNGNTVIMPSNLTELEMSQRLRKFGSKQNKWISVMGKIGRKIVQTTQQINCYKLVLMLFDSQWLNDKPVFG